MPHQSHEQTINSALGEILEALGKDWVVQSEEIGRIFEDGGRPDVLVQKPDGWPIVLEAEVGNHRQAESDAQARLHNRVVATNKVIETAVAVVYPEELRRHRGHALREAIRTTNFEYALFSTGADGGAVRLPGSGWLSGDVTALALLLHRSSVSAWRADTLADSLERGVERAAQAFSHAHPPGSALGASVAFVLGQTDDDAGQTRRMAMTVIVNALIFHAALAEAEMSVDDGRRARPVRPPPAFRRGNNFLPTPLLDEWDRILRVNYWPIFHTAGAILRELPTQSAVSALGTLWETAEELIAAGVTKSHDLTGVIFQRLIADRKFLATYYTRPAAAALLAGMAIPVSTPIRGTPWDDARALAEMRMGDFACGTGTLLSTAYQRFSLLHEVHGGDPKALHPAMMKHGLVGLDVLNVAVHLTATMLAGSHPDTPFEGDGLLTMPYGRHDWGVSVGSLDLLEEQGSFEIVRAAARTAGGMGEQEVRDLLERVGHGQFDLVIMNPPFTRHGAREGERTAVHNPAFAAFEATEEEQDLLAAHLSHLAKGSAAHGHAGMASYFVELGHRKLARGGTIALVLPLTSMSGQSWEAVRQLWNAGYSSILVTTIAERSNHTRSFSADTGMAECLVVAKKTPQHCGDVRASFIILNAQPQSTLEGDLIAQAISSAVSSGDVRRLEDGPVGGSRISIGNTQVGEVVSCPLPSEGPWQMVGINDMTLGQTAYQLSRGRLWIEGMSAGSAPPIPMATIGEVASRIGPHHLDITGSQIKADGLPQGPFEKIDGLPAGAAYPCLWNHDASRERKLIVAPDSHCRIRQVRERLRHTLQERADARWATASRAHYNHDLRFNSQSLIVAMTERPSLGGRAWPTVVFANNDHEYAFTLWSNSTLGLLCHWWMANKSQAGRGTTTPTSIPGIATLDLSALTEAQHAAAKEAFGVLADYRFLPFDQIDEDRARAELDRRLLIDVLGLDPGLCEAGGHMELLRTKLAGEAQIRADKQTRLVFTDDGETSVRRGSLAAV